jgi:cobalt-zinc-cadmium efflux system membrane fusion protein
MKLTHLRTIFPILLLAVPFASCSDEHDDQEHHEPASDHEEGHVELTEDQFASAGIEVQAVGPGRIIKALTLPGSIAPNADAVLHVTPRVAGRVRVVHKKLGQQVEAGDLLCILDSVSLGDAAAGYMRAKAVVQSAEETLERERALFEGRLETLTSTLDGAIAVQQRIFDRERELQEKAVSTIRPLLEAEKALQTAVLNKERQLTELRAERDARLLELDVALRATRIDLAAAANRLRALGVQAESLEEITEGSPLLSGRYDVLAPGAGVVVDRHVSRGEYVEAGAKLFIVEDLSKVWFVASVFEDHLQAVRVGQAVRVLLDAFPATALAGTVSFVAYSVDPTSRSVGVRVELDNQQLQSWSEDFPLRPGMFGRAELETSSREVALLLPEAALAHEDDGDYVFVQVEPLGFERRKVDVRYGAGGMVEVVQGLEQGASVAVAGTFLLKSAERQSELGGGHSH